MLPDIYNPQGLNRYSYVINNPVKYTDPTGHAWWTYPLRIIKHGGNTAFIVQDLADLTQRMDATANSVSDNGVLSQETAEAAAGVFTKAFEIGVIGKGDLDDAADVLKGARNKGSDLYKGLKGGSTAAKLDGKGLSAFGMKKDPIKVNYPRHNKATKWDTKTIEGTGVKNAPAQYKPGTNIEFFEQTAWKEGNAYTTEGHQYILYDTGAVIGADCGEETTKILVDVTGGFSHSRPISETNELYKTLTAAG